ncbi:MAG: EamA family transporter RarD [Actinobacteria bacterium]|nr:EamA family transporter RarD [Actinomycetota bacterium]
MTRYRTGLVYGVAAYVIWGLLPLYWGAMGKTKAFEIISHRAVWSLLVCFIALAFRKEFRSAFKALKNPRTLALLALTSGLLSANWAIYIWSVTVNRVVEASLGYYITPLVNVAFGVFMLREKMRPLQWAAVSVAAIGVAALTFDFGHLPWIAIGLAVSWGLYSVIKKSLPVTALQGLTVETLIAMFPTLTYLSMLQVSGDAAFGNSLWLSLGLAGAGIMTVAPLLFFNGSTVRLPLSVVGLLQYITPTIMFIIGVTVNGEAMPLARWIGFFAIWVALICLGSDLWKSGRASNQGIAQS